MIEGTLNSMPNGTYALDFFASFVRDSLTNGEGQVYLGTTMVATGGDSNATFSMTLPVGVTTGRWITATATDTNNNTSEFSAAFRASSTKPRVMVIVVNTNDSGPGSLRQAILANNSSFTLSNNLIQFQIPGGGVQTITPLTSFPGLTEAVTVDGYSQPGARTNTLAAGDNAVLQIRIDGLSAGSGADGLRLEIDRCIVRGLSVTRSRSSAPIISLREIF